MVWDDALANHMLGLLHNKIKIEKRRNKNNKCSKCAYKSYIWTRFIRNIAVFLILSLHYVIRPKWCIEKFKNTSDYDKCGFNINYND